MVLMMTQATSVMRQKFLDYFPVLIVHGCSLLTTKLAPQHWLDHPLRGEYV